MTPSKFPSFLLSFGLHLAVAALAVFLPLWGTAPSEPARSTLISGIVTLGKEGRSRPAPAQQRPGTQSAAEKPRKPVEKPAARESKAVAQLQKPTTPEPRPEVKPVEKPREQSKPTPPIEATPIPREPEKKKPAEKKPPEKVVAKKAETKKEPPKKQEAKSKKEDMVAQALRSLDKETRQREPGGKKGETSAPKGQSADDVVASWQKEFGASGQDMQGEGSGDDARGDGPGGSGGDGLGIPGNYFESIMTRVQNNWSSTQRADRTVYIAVVNIQISPDGSILHRHIVTSSGNPLYDSAVLLAIDNTTDLEPTPSQKTLNLNIEFDSNDMNRH